MTPTTKDYARYLEFKGRFSALMGAGAGVISALILVALWGQWRSFGIVAAIQLSTIGFNLWFHKSLLPRVGSHGEPLRIAVCSAASICTGIAAHWVLPVWLLLPYLALVQNNSRWRVGLTSLGVLCVVQDIASLLQGVPALYPLCFTSLALFCGASSAVRNTIIFDVLSKSDAQQARLKDAEERAIGANRAKSAFLANMSHEIRTPMTAILGFGDLLLDPSLPERDRAEHVRIIQRNGKHLLGLIDDVLDLSKIEADRLTLERVPTSPIRIIADVVSLFRVLALAKGICVRVVYETAVPATIQSDPTRLRQIVLNLVSNALKFTSWGGVTLTVRCEDADGAEPKLMIAISDTGLGIPPDKLQAIFEPFSQADISTTRKYGGTGLGLTISTKLAKALGGYLGVESRLGVGSTFTLTVPCGSLAGVAMLQDEQEGGSMDTSPGRKIVAPLSGHVLLAEDGPDNQTLISAYLKRAGAAVTVAENGRIAVGLALEARVAGNPFDLVLMDMQMPVLDGYGATRELRAAGYSLPIVALTAHAMTHDKEKCIEAGCTDYLTKPIDRDELAATLKKYLRATEDADTSPPVVSTFAADEGMRELVQGFVRNLPERAKAVEAALTAGDDDGLRRAVHQLRGAGGGYGFPTLTDAAARVESALADGVHGAALEPLVRALAVICRGASSI
jgi:signal transduction histidine kinase/CheY-like chemotaxis protein/HPt (histidine-containing phosphotransfer) domain-containing protein